MRLRVDLDKPCGSSPNLLLSADQFVVVFEAHAHPQTPSVTV